MRTFLLLLYIFSPIVLAVDYPSCDITKEKEVSFRSFQSKDTLSVSVVGNPCYEAILTLEVVTESKERIYKYESEFQLHTPVSWEDPELDQVAEELAERIIQSAIGNTAELPISFKCELPSESCVSYEKNTIPLGQYKKIREDALPLLSHPTYYEGWASYIFDSEAMVVIKVYEGGV